MWVKRFRTQLHPELARLRMRQCFFRGFPRLAQDLRSHHIESASRLNPRRKILVQRLQDKVQSRPYCQDRCSCCRDNRVRHHVSVWSTEGNLPDHPKCPSMEVALHTEHNGLPLLNMFLLIGPLTRELDSCFYSFCTSIHWQHHVVFEERGYLLSERSKI